MADKSIVVSFQRIPKREKKKVVRQMTRDVVRNKGYRKTLKRQEAPIPKPVAMAAAKAAVEVTLDQTMAPAPAPEKTALEKYADLVAAFARARRSYRKNQKKRFKAAKKQGYNAKTGVYDLKPLKKVKAAKKVKPYKAKKPKKK